MDEEEYAMLIESEEEQYRERLQIALSMMTPWR